MAKKKSAKKEAVPKPIKKAIDYLILTVERGNISYITLPTNFRDEGSTAKQIVTDLTTELVKILNAGARDYVHGVYYVTTKAAPVVAVPYFEVDNATPELNADAQLWMNDIVNELATTIQNSKVGKSSFRQGYTGIQLSWT